jgi:hypothetical protein
MECTRICKRTIQNGSLTDTDCLIATCLYLHHQRHTASIASTCDDDIHKHNSLTAIQLHTKPLPAMIHAVSLLHPRFSPQHPGSLDNGYRGARLVLSREFTPLRGSPLKLQLFTEAIQSFVWLLKCVQLTIAAPLNLFVSHQWIILLFVFCISREILSWESCLCIWYATVER